MNAPTKIVDTPYGKKTLDRSFEIPYLAGYSKDGKTVYIDKRLNPFLELSDGQKMDTIKYLVIHESAEKHLMDTEGYKYQYAHREATGIEKESVETDGYSWDEYQKYALSEVQRLKKLDPEAKLPKDLDIKPEVDTQDYDFLKIIQQHQKEGTMLKNISFNIKRIAWSLIAIDNDISMLIDRAFNEAEKYIKTSSVDMVAWNNYRSKIIGLINASVMQIIQSSLAEITTGISSPYMGKKINTIIEAVKKKLNSTISENIMKIFPMFKNKDPELPRHVEKIKNILKGEVTEMVRPFKEVDFDDLAKGSKNLGDSYYLNFSKWADKVLKEMDILTL